MNATQTRKLIESFNRAWNALGFDHYTSPGYDLPVDITTSELIAEYVHHAQRVSADLPSFVDAGFIETVIEPDGKKFTPEPGDSAQKWLHFTSLAVAASIMATDAFYNGDED